MAVRSGAGTGVIVSLVVFVLTTVFLLILTIVFYSGKTKALEEAAGARDDLKAYATAQQRGSDQFKAFEQAASQNGQSVAGYLNDRYEDLMRFVSNDTSKSLEEAMADFERYGIAEGDDLTSVMSTWSRNRKTSEVEVESLKDRVGELEEEVSEKDSLVARLRTDHDEELRLVGKEIATYRDAAVEYQDDLQRTIAQLNEVEQRLEEQYRGEIHRLEDDLDVSGRELTVLRARVEEYEAIFDKIRTKPTSPDLLVDGSIIESDLAKDQVFINRGRRDRIVLGMTFEVYDDAASIRPGLNGDLPRGKASLQVIKVGDTTSTCKLRRTIPGRPVVRNNVIANAIYDPEYEFKFFVHGKFDVDRDGRPTTAETDFIRGRILEWGGQVVDGETLPGDLDFLLLGEMPPPPPPLPANATPHQVDLHIKQRTAHNRYRELMSQASEAQIPVLNQNRFFTLIGESRG